MAKCFWLLFCAAAICGLAVFVYKTVNHKNTRESDLVEKSEKSIPVNGRQNGHTSGLAGCRKEGAEKEKDGLILKETAEREKIAEKSPDEPIDTTPVKVEIPPYPQGIQGLRNKTRLAPQLSGEEVFKLHWELYHLVDIHKAPTAREMEIWEILEERKPMDSRTKPTLILEGMAKWGTGQNSMRAARCMYIFDSKEILDQTLVRADILLNLVNDPISGRTIPGEGDKPPPIFVDVNKETNKTSCSYLGHGVKMRAAVTMANWILEHPELHDQYPTGSLPGSPRETYLEKAKKYLFISKGMCEHLLKYKHFNETIGFWMIPATGRWEKFGDEKGEVPTALNRGMIFNEMLMATAAGLVKLDSNKYADWHKRAEHVCRRSFEYLKNVNLCQYNPRCTKYPTENEYGPLYVYPYRQYRNNSEDQIHFVMDMRAMIAIERWLPGVFAKDDWKALANTALFGFYDFKTHRGHKAIFRSPQKPYESHPFFMNIVGRYMPQEVYDQAMTELLMLWERKLKALQVDRADRGSIYDEILKGRLYRYGKPRW